MCYSTFILEFNFEFKIDKFNKLENQLTDLLKQHPDKIDCLASGLIFLNDYGSADNISSLRHNSNPMLGFHYTRGFCYEQLGLPQIALKCYQQVKTDPYCYDEEIKKLHQDLLAKAQHKITQLNLSPISEKTVLQLALERVVMSFEEKKDSYEVNKEIEDGIKWIQKQYTNPYIFKKDVLSTIYFIDLANSKSKSCNSTFSIPLIFASINMWNIAEALLIQGTRIFIDFNKREEELEQPPILARTLEGEPQLLPVLNNAVVVTIEKVPKEEKNFCLERLKERKQEKLLEFERFLSIIVDSFTNFPNELKEIFIDYYGFKSFVFLGNINGYNLHGHLKRSPLNELMTPDDKTVKNIKMVENNQSSVLSLIIRAKQKLSAACAQAKPIRTKTVFEPIYDL